MPNYATEVERLEAEIKVLEGRVRSLEIDRAGPVVDKALDVARLRKILSMYTVWTREELLSLLDNKLSI